MLTRIKIQNKLINSSFKIKDSKIDEKPIKEDYKKKSV
jgi:hypothetical protein